MLPRWSVLSVSLSGTPCNKCLELCPNPCSSFSLSHSFFLPNPWERDRRAKRATLLSAARLREEGGRFFVALGGASFGRCDVRVNAGGTPYFLEINPNCGVYYPPSDPGSAALCLMKDPAGHEGFTRQLVRAALVRHARRQAVD